MKLPAYLSHSPHPATDALRRGDVRSAWLIVRHALRAESRTIANQHGCHVPGHGTMTLGCALRRLARDEGTDALGRIVGLAHMAQRTLYRSRAARRRRG